MTDIIKIPNFIGQQNIVRDLEILITASLKKGKMPAPIGFAGPKGNGKTYLSKKIAECFKAHYVERQGFNIRDERDLYDIIYDEEDMVVFIDEIQDMSSTVQTFLRHILDSEEYPILWIFATTDFGKVLEPVRNRIFNMYTLKHYSVEEMVKIVQLMGIEHEGVAQIIAENSRFTPRTAKALVGKYQDEKCVFEVDDDPQLIKNILERLSISPQGVEHKEVEILKLLNEGTGSENFVYRKKGIGSTSIISKVNVQKKDYHEVYEPYLIKLGLIEVTTSGRRITKLGEQYLKQLN